MTWRLGPVDQRTGGGRPPSAGAVAAPGLLGSPLLVALALFVGMLMIAAAPASAKLVWQQAGSIDGTATPSGSFDGPGRLAIDQSAKVLYVLDQGHDALLKYDISGNAPVLADFSALGSPEIDGTGTADLTPQGTLGLTVNADIAVDNSGGPTDGYIYVVTGVAGFSGGGQVDVFDPTGTYRYQFASNATSVAVDSTGAVYTTPLYGLMTRYTSSTTAATVDPNFSLTLSLGTSSVAIDDEGRFYTSASPALFGTPGVSRYTATGAADGQITAKETTDIAVGPTDDHIYMDHGNSVAEYDRGGTSRLHEFGTKEFNDSTGIAAGPSGNIFVADGKEDRIRWYQTAILPDVTAGQATNVTASTATLNGTVNPDGVPLTACEFQWGRSGHSGYSGQPVPCAPTPGQSAGATTVSANISGLTSGTYHFRLRTENINGVTYGQNSSFTVGKCTNITTRIGPSASLPDCRAYEMVSPPDKSANTLIITTAAGAAAYSSPGGSAVYFKAATPFARPVSGRLIQAVAARSSSGWRTHNLTPKGCLKDPSGVTGGFGIAGFSEDFSTPIFTTQVNIAGQDPNCATGDRAGADVYTLSDTGSLTWVSRGDGPKTVNLDAAYVGSSADAKHIVFSTQEKLVLPLENGRTVGDGLYDRTGGKAVPVGLKSGGGLINSCGAAIAGKGVADPFGQVSNDGRVIFFNSGSSTTVSGCSPTTDDGGQLYARIDASRTILLSRSQLTTPEARQIPKFLGATSDGRRMFFTSTERLTDNATPGGGLYEYDLTEPLAGSGDGELTFLSPSIDGSPANVTSLVGTSDNGTVVYITATGVLDAEGATGKQNLYRVTATGVEYVATLATTSVRTPSMSVAPDGSKLVYLDTAPSGTQQLWMFDADDPTRGINCASCPDDDAAAMGDTKLYGSLSNNARPRMMGQSRYVTNDGRVYFSSPDQLSGRDVNRRYDVYEYDHGSRELISSGTSSQDSLLLGVSPDGRDVFFATNDSLVGQDFDNGDQDIYDARVGGGFPPPPAPVIPCSGDECQPQERAPVLGVPGSVAFVAPWAPALRAVPAPKARPKKVSVKRPKTVRGKTKVWLSVKAPEAGRIRVSGSGLRRAKKTAKKAKTYRVTVKLSKRSKRILRRTHLVRVRATVRFTPKHGKRSRVRVHVTFKQRKHHGKAKRRSHDRAQGSARKGGR